MNVRTGLPLSHCGRCEVLWLATRGRAGGAVVGTQRSREAFLACFNAGTHRIEHLGTVDVARIVDLALLTIIRECPRLDLVDRAHVSRALLSVPEPYRRAGIPGRLLSSYGLTGDGTRTALKAVQYMIIDSRDDVPAGIAWRNIRNTIQESL